MKEHQQVVVSVHGTFAAADEDEGPAWWQHGSEFWRQLTRKLQANCHQIPKEQTFHWDGNNSAASRREAARNLLALVIELEKKEQPYHLIGHSHGGSVIWDTLMLAHRRFKREWTKKSKSTPNFHPLEYLASWTTVGTPFVIARPSALRMFFAVFAGIFAFSFLIISILLPILSLTGVLTSDQSMPRQIPTWVFTASYVVLFYVVLSTNDCRIGGTSAR